MGDIHRVHLKGFGSIMRLLPGEILISAVSRNLLVQQSIEYMKLNELSENRKSFDAGSFVSKVLLNTLVWHSSANKGRSYFLDAFYCMQI
jgi:hypothetical protein